MATQNKIIIALLSLMVIIAVAWFINNYQEKKSQEIYDYCFRKSNFKTSSDSDSYTFFELFKIASVNECVNLVKNMGGIDKFIESINNTVVDRFEMVIKTRNPEITDEEIERMKENIMEMQIFEK